MPYPALPQSQVQQRCFLSSANTLAWGVGRWGAGQGMSRGKPLPFPLPSVLFFPPKPTEAARIREGSSEAFKPGKG